MKRALTVAVLLACGTAAPASADEPVTDPYAAHSLNAARAYWGTNVACAHMVSAPEPAQPAAASAELGGCRIWLYPDWYRDTRRARCETIVHEYGHLLGREHTTDGGIMDPVRSSRLVPECSGRRSKGRKIPVERVRRTDPPPPQWLVAWLMR